MTSPPPDRDLEDLLRRFRPVGPPPALRLRVLSVQPVLRSWPWAVAAAATLVLVAVLHVSSNRALASAQVPQPPDPWSPIEAALRRQLGDAPGAERLASTLVDSARYQLADAAAEAHRAVADQR